jgi:aspartate/methionine/tyrosine aminotransferase
MNPSLMKSSDISEDARNRASQYSKLMGSPIGAYTGNSKGYQVVREKVAQYISQRDGVQADPNNIYMTNGASEGVRTAFNLLIRKESDGVMIPIP